MSDGALLHTLKFSIVGDIAFSPDGKLIAGASDNDWAKVWRVSDGSLVAQLVNEQDNYGSGGNVMDIEFSPEGKTVYGGTNLGTISMWQVP
jgi:WD40 repeat protein